MNSSRVLLPAVAGTSLMTLFSYIMSQYEKENFSEPALLAAMGERILPKGAKPLAVPAGWLAHYGIGILFTSLYKSIPEEKDNKPVIQGVLLGVCSGVTGVAAWQLLFKLHPAPPSLTVRTFFKQLLWAHIVFGVSLSAVDRYLNKVK